MGRSPTSRSGAHRRRLAALAALLAFAACEGYTTSVANRQPLTPFPVYEEWWAEMEACSGRTGDLRAIRWFTATGITSDGAVASGMWQPPHDIIIVLGYEEDDRVVRHEMLHDLLAGDSNHESPLWDACAPIPG